MLQQFAFAALPASLVLFWISTRQFPLLVRGLIRIVAAALLAFAAQGALEAAKISEVSLDQRSITVLRDVAVENLRVVDAAWRQVFVLLLLFALPIAGITLLAFTPGETIERIARPATIALIGALVGATVMLGLTALGLGGAMKRNAYVAIFADGDVADGDTLRFGDVTVRLNNLEAPEIDQTCLGPRRDCGALAANRLRFLVRGKLVVCSLPASSDRVPPKETFGRPILDCTVAGQSLARDLIGSGHAIAYRRRGAPLVQPQDFTLGCTLAPDAWRRRTADGEITAAEIAAAPESDRIGDCAAFLAPTAR